MSNNLYLICDESNTLVRIGGIKMFGVKCTIPAIFMEEEQALAVLFELEEANLLEDKRHAVRKIDGSFTSAVMR
jgi:hypothetical protein